MFYLWGRTVCRIRWPIAAIALAIAAVGGVWGTGVFTHLVGGGFTDPSSLSATAEARITATLGSQSPDVLVLYSSKSATVTDPAFREPVAATLASVRRQTGVASVLSYYNTGDLALVARSRHATYAVVRFSSPDDTGKLATFARLRPHLTAPGVTTQVGGVIAIDSAASQIAKKDVTRGELIAFPLVLILLLLIFGAPPAAATPLLLGGLAVLGALTATRVISEFTSVSTFAINSITLLGLGMGVDYSLLIVGRFREELTAGHDPRDAVARTMESAGRTVFVSALTVALALASLLIFPEVFLRSMGFGGVAAVLIAMLSALTVLPAILGALGPRINAGMLPLPWLHGQALGRASLGETEAWARLAHSVMRNPVRYIVAVAVVVFVLALPLMNVRWDGGTDTRVLPVGTQARVVSQEIAADFPGGGNGEPIEALIEHAPAPEVRALAGQIDRMPGVISAVPTAHRRGNSLLQVNYTGQASGDQAASIVAGIRALPQPRWVRILVGGTPADNTDLLANLRHLLPWMALIMIVVTFVLLFAAFGSIVLPITAVVMNLASIAAAAGVVVWGFQDGHLAGWLGFTSTGSLQPNIPILILAVLFGLATDYEVFLVSRIREAWDHTGDNQRAITYGLQRTGRIITAAALLLIVVVAGFATGKIVFTEMIGVGMIVALLVDASMVRILLVPTTMRLLGRLNWWLPGPLDRVYRRYGIRDAAEPVPAPAPRAPSRSGTGT